MVPIILSIFFNSDMNIKINSLTTLAVFTALVVQAQTNTSVVSQTGNMQSATAVQSGSGQNSSIRQFTGSSTTANVGNVATTTQTGSAPSGTTNLVFVDQINGAFNNKASVKQQWAGTASDAPNVATVLQSENASRNVATVSQEGNGKSADLQQSDRSSDNQATITQIGGQGIVTLFQSSQATNNQATIAQTATALGVNQGTIFQATQSYYNQAMIEQAGTAGVALISQNDQSANNVGIIMQGATGTNNVAAIVQTNAYDGASAGASTVLGAANSASISQNQTTASSTGNSAVITQGSFDPSPATGTVVVSTGNTASVSQELDLNVTDLLQVGTGNTATVMQNGNSTLKGVNGAMGTNPTAGQYGNTNTLTVTQSGTFANPSIGNVTQIGIGNVSTISQRVPVVGTP